MRLDLYLEETRHSALRRGELLDEARKKLLDGHSLSRLEQAGVLHLLQLLVENAIGKAKHLLKEEGKNIPVSAHDTFDELAETGLLNPTMLEEWHAIIGLRNRIVHDYMNIDMDWIQKLVQQEKYRMLVDFLCAPFPSER